MRRGPVRWLPPLPKTPHLEHKEASCWSPRADVQMAREALAERPSRLPEEATSWLPGASPAGSAGPSGLLPAGTTCSCSRRRRP